MDGILVINKPKGYTSQDVVSRVKKILNISKAGHTGTLDPNATGVLPVLLGKATKLSKYLIEHGKSYEATIKFGEKRDTGDIEGDVIEKQEFNISNFSKTEIEEILASFIGKQKQLPPMYSAIKVDGKKLYEYAREGKKIEREERDIEIYSINLKEILEEENEIVFTVSCSKGTYIRVLCEDIAKKLNTVGFMNDLTRINVDKFELVNSITLNELEKIKDSKEILNKVIISIEKCFSHNEKVVLEEKELNLFLNGARIHRQLDNNVYRVYTNQNEFLGLRCS